MGIPIKDSGKKFKILSWLYLRPYTISMTDQFNKTIKPVEENIEQSLYSFGVGKDFLGKIQTGLTMKKKKIIWIMSKLKPSAQQKIKRVKRQITEQKIFGIHIID